MRRYCMLTRGNEQSSLDKGNIPRSKPKIRFLRLEYIKANEITILFINEKCKSLLP